MAIVEIWRTKLSLHLGCDLLVLGVDEQNIPICLVKPDTGNSRSNTAAPIGGILGAMA
jgi:hypothetical protein